VIVAGATYVWTLDGTPLTTTATAYLKIATAGVYTVQVVKDNCGSSVSADFNAVATGIRNNKSDVSFDIIPNPNNGDFEIRMYSRSNKKYSLTLYNVAGQQILKDELNVKTGYNSQKINLTGIEKGSYILSITGDTGTTTQNIIVQ
jgi:hypothetical protein